MVSVGVVVVVGISVPVSVVSDVPVMVTTPVSVRMDVSVVPLIVSVATVSVTVLSLLLHPAGNIAATRTAARAMIRRFICSSEWNGPSGTSEKADAVYIGV